MSYGQKKGTVRDLIFIHGSPGSRLFFPSAHAESSKQAGVKVWVVERPGFGMSTPDPALSYSSFAADISLFLRHFAITQYTVVGYSAGAPYALAVGALASPAPQAVCIISSIAPATVREVYKEMTCLSCLGWCVVSHCGCCVPCLTSMDMSAMREDPIKKLREDMYQMYCPQDYMTYTTNADIEKLFVESAMENAVVPSSAAITSRELLSFNRPWGFQLKEVTKKCPVYQWAGDADTACVPYMARVLEKELGEKCVTTWGEGLGHLYFFSSFLWAQVLSKTIGREREITKDELEAKTA
eukprot:gb/GEZN01012634.1/.p1 GENE.gb/GEZN01012634.1/~~gb/GEZN01012634.1/.p1  ORF type:complete len:350 (+),score=35.00 gb/GEZN01012634.1/:158-1051(+)